MKQCLSLRGVHDILPPFATIWRQVEAVAVDCFRCYGYQEIRTPIIEHLSLFSEPLGNQTDIVQKEMYTFIDSHSGESIVLRPEATVSTVRALLKAGMHRSGLIRVCYHGPMFRHERPQRGRYRQFHQIGAEALGELNAALDAEQIIMLARLWRSLGIAGNLVLDINNLGSAAERKHYRQKLSDYFHLHWKYLDAIERQRVKTNPLRILDSKNEQTISIVATAPKLLEVLGDESRRYVDNVKSKIAAAGITFNERNTLVRGLDYYNLTVYEWVLIDDSRRQNAVCGGGRYDGLAESISGIKMPGCGFAIGLERLLNLLRRQDIARADCYLAVCCKDDTFASQVAEVCRDEAISVWRGARSGNISKHIKKASAMQVPVMAIIGEEESECRQVTVKRLSDGKQQRCSPQMLGAIIREWTDYE